MDEEARAGDPGDTALKLGVDVRGEELGEQPVDGLALGQHGAPLGGRDVLGDAR